MQRLTDRLRGMCQAGDRLAAVALTTAALLLGGCANLLPPAQPDQAQRDVSAPAASLSNAAQTATAPSAPAAGRISRKRRCPAAMAGTAALSSCAVLDGVGRR